jgi:hypothetical protein
MAAIYPVLTEKSRNEKGDENRTFFIYVVQAIPEYCEHCHTP